MTRFEFDAEFQRALLRLLMLDESFCAKALKYLDASYFSSRSLGWVFVTLKHYFDTYGIRCTDLPLRQAARHQPEFAPEVEAMLAMLFVPEADYVKEQLKEFVRRNIFAKAHEQSQKFYNDGQHTKAYDVTCRAMDELRLIDFNAPDRSWFFENVTDRTRRRYWRSLDPTKGVYPTGIDPVDDAMDGGPRKGEVHLVMGIPKVGKSIWLINRGFVATRVLRVPTLHFNLEGSMIQCEDRYDACFMGELYANVRRGEITPSLYREMLSEYEQLRKLLVIRTINNWEMSVLDLDAELKELKNIGFVPEMIVLDYVDLLRSRTPADSEREHQTNSMKDVKLVANRGYCIWTACQGQRPTTANDEREWVLKSHQISESYAKIRICDGYGSINMTNQEKKNGTCRYYLEGWRDGEVGKMFRLKNEMNKMRHAIGVVEEPPSGGTGSGTPTV
jgi:replicative DNA helicase